MSHWIGWKEITEKTKMSRTTILELKDFGLPLGRIGRSPILVANTFYNFLETYCSSCQFEPAQKKPVK